MDTREQLRQLEEQVSKGLEKAYLRMVEMKKHKNTPMVIAKNGEVISIPAEKILPATRAMNPYPTNPPLDQSTDHS